MQMPAAVESVVVSESLREREREREREGYQSVRAPR